jgi:hypothetical protein
MIWKCMSVLGVFAASSAWAAPTVTMSGDCPGVITITVDNITPGECIGIAYGDDAGGAGQIVNRGDCTGTVMGLDPMNYAFSACDYDGDGSITFSPDIGAGACGTSFQILDMDSCEASDVERIDLSATSEYYYEVYDVYYYAYYGPTTYDDYTDPSYWTDDYVASDCEAAGGVDAWISDGFCDSSNNIEACDWDGGDCDTTGTTGYYGTYDDGSLAYSWLEYSRYHGSYHTTDYGSYSSGYSIYTDLGLYSYSTSWGYYGTDTTTGGGTTTSTVYHAYDYYPYYGYAYWTETYYYGVYDTGTTPTYTYVDPYYWTDFHYDGYHDTLYYDRYHTTPHSDPYYWTDFHYDGYHDTLYYDRYHTTPHSDPYYWTDFHYDGYHDTLYYDRYATMYDYYTPSYTAYDYYPFGTYYDMAYGYTSWSYDYYFGGEPSTWVYDYYYLPDFTYYEYTTLDYYTIYYYSPTVYDYYTTWSYDYYFDAEPSTWVYDYYYAPDYDGGCWTTAYGYEICT